MKSLLKKIYYKLDYMRRKFRRFPRGSIILSKGCSGENILSMKADVFSNESKSLSIDYVMPDLAFDVGAYTGNSIVRLNSMGFSRIVCFEPDPDNYSSLVREFSGHQDMAFFNFAVSEQSGSLMTLTSNRDCPWLNTLHQDWISGTRHEQHFSRVEKYLVESITLNQVIEMYGVIPAYIKIDVEGHELNVLKGLRYKPDLLSFEWISEKSEKNISVLRHLVDKGFTEFYICMQEETPDLKLPGLNIENCLAELSLICSKDIGNNLFGNIFSR